MKTGITLLSILLLAGCATTPPPAPVSLADVISMTKAGLTDNEIIRRIDETRTVFRLGSDDVVRLRQEGVTDPVVNYMLDTYTHYVVAEQRRRDAVYADDYYFRYGYYYGQPWYRWSW
jgi:hypothetical protein